MAMTIGTRMADRPSARVLLIEQRWRGTVRAHAVRCSGRCFAPSWAGLWSWAVGKVNEIVSPVGDRRTLTSGPLQRSFDNQFFACGTELPCERQSGRSLPRASLRVSQTTSSLPAAKTVGFDDPRFDRVARFFAVGVLECNSHRVVGGPERTVIGGGGMSADRKAGF